MQSKRISSIQFGLLSADAIVRNSVMEVECSQTFEKGKPKQGGLMDPRMGTVDRCIKCATCGGNMKECTGHFGHINLGVPVYHCAYIGHVVKLLRCVCFSCSSLLCDPAEFGPKVPAHKKRARVARFRNVTATCRNICKCPACGADQPRFHRDGGAVLIERHEGERKFLPAAEAHLTLRHVTDEALGAMGVDSRPESMVITALPIPPPCMRPSITVDGSFKGDDDLTHKLVDVVKTNQAACKALAEGADADQLQELESTLYFQIASYFDNEVPGQPQAMQRSGKPLSSITHRLRGKEGRVRGNLMGKRVDFSARTVITPDPNLGIDEVGVPVSIASNLTFPEHVVGQNMARLQRLVDNGPGSHPGAKYVLRRGEDGHMQQIDLRYMNAMGKTFRLRRGDVVERHLLDGDVVLFNRQPSLHKMSIMGHTVRITDGKTFRLNLTVTTPYNADFDGDEMNLHVPQDESTCAEAEMLMKVPLQVISPQSNKPVMGVVQDALLGAYGMTRPGVLLTRKQALNLCARVGKPLPEAAVVEPEERWTGRQIISTVLPAIHLRRGDGRDGVLIRAGRLLSGSLCKQTLGTGNGGVVHTCMNTFGPDETKRFLNEVQFLVNAWILYHGHSVGVSDIVMQDRGAVRGMIRQAYTDVDGLVAEMHGADFEKFEARVNQTLNRTRDMVGAQVQGTLDPSNRFKRMVDAGSKGSNINLSQVCAMVGQQNVEGRRIPLAYSGRSLPHYTRFEHAPESRGFVQHSYVEGLTPQEFFFHAMGGREGLIDTAVKTSETGYIQRRLMKAMEDVSVHYDYTVRNSTGQILQFVYGEDGMDATCIEKQRFDMHAVPMDEFRRRYAPPEPATAKAAAQYADMVRRRGVVQRRRIVEGTTVHLPVAMQRVVDQARRTHYAEEDLTQDEAVDALAAMFEAVADLSECQRRLLGKANFLFETHAMTWLCARRAVRMGRHRFLRVVDVVGRMYTHSFAHPGDMVGAISAQSIGEPATQVRAPRSAPRLRHR